MNTSPDFDRDAIARAVFDTAICPEHSEIHDALDTWIALIERMAGYLACSACSIGLGEQPPAEYLYGLGEAIDRSAKIAGVLAGEMWLQIHRRTQGTPSSQGKEL